MTIIYASKRWIFAVAALSGLGAANAAAQASSESRDAKLRADCRLAAQVLTSGRPDPHFEWARDIISACDISGPPALASVWAHPPTDTLELLRLVYSTERLRDRRILDAVASVAESPAQPQAGRLSALMVLISFFDAGHTETFARLRTPPIGAPLGGPAFEFAATEGAQPVQMSDRPGLLALMDRVAASDPDTTLRNAARFVAQGFRVIQASSH